jgi:hypothetical protein
MKRKTLTFITDVGSEVPTAVIMETSIFCDIILCSPLKVNVRFGGRYRLHLQGRRINQTRNERERRWQIEELALHGVIFKKIVLFTTRSAYHHLLSRWFLARLILQPWRWRRYVPPEHRLTLNGLRSVISQKIVFFIYKAFEIVSRIALLSG